MRCRTRCAVRWPRRPAPERWLRVPIDFHIDRSRGLVVTEAVGTVEVPDIAEHIKRLTNTPDRPPLEIADFSSQVRLTLAPAVARSAARALAAVDGGDGGVTPRPRGQVRWGVRDAARVRGPSAGGRSGGPGVQGARAGIALAGCCPGRRAALIAITRGARDGGVRRSCARHRRLLHSYYGESRGTSV